MQVGDHLIDAKAAVSGEGSVAVGRAGVERSLSSSTFRRNTPEQLLGDKAHFACDAGLEADALPLADHAHDFEALDRGVACISHHRLSGGRLGG